MKPDGFLLKNVEFYNEMQDHSKAQLLASLGGNERVARRLTVGVKEYWGDNNNN